MDDGEFDLAAAAAAAMGGGGDESDSAMEWPPLIIAITLLNASVMFSLYVAISSWISWKQPAASLDDVKITNPLLVNNNKSLEMTMRHDDDDDEEETDEEAGSAAICKNKIPLLSWSKVSCTYPATKAGMESKQTLKGAFGELYAGELMAIMGPSGGGKSTLMDILAGRKETGKITGSLSVLGKTLRSKNLTEAGALLQDITAYVPQEVMFFPMQTPEEAVMFVAGLKHGKTSVTAARQILYDVGLKDPSLYSRPIGGLLAGGMAVRGLSGGERKRLALACALAMDPRLIMLDEITSGLDSESALSTMQLLKELCVKRGVAAIVIIHQPDGYVFDCFNRLLLVSRGDCVFSGELDTLGRLYESRFGCDMPVSHHEVPLDLLRRLKRLPEDGQKTSTSSTCDDSVVEDTTTMLPSSNLQQQQQQRESLLEARHPPVSFYRKLSIVFHRNLMNHYVRNVTNLCARLFCYSACSLLDGAIFWQVGTKNGTGTSIVGALTFVILISYLLPFASIPIFVHEKKFFLFERSLGLYSPWIYCISQTLLEAWVVILASTCEAAIVVPMCALWNPDAAKWESFLTHFSSLSISGLTGSGLVLFFSILMPSQDLAFLVGSGVVTLSLGMSGGFVPFPSIEDFVSWLQWISPCKYSLQALVIGYTPESKEPLLVKAMEFDRPATISANIGVLLVMSAALSFGTMFVLTTKREVR